MSALKIEGERTDQADYSSVTTGAKNFGSLFTNPNIAHSANSQMNMLAVGGLVVVAGLLVLSTMRRKRRGR